MNEKLERELFVSAGYFAPSFTGVKALRVVLYSLLTLHEKLDLNRFATEVNMMQI